MSSLFGTYADLLRSNRNYRNLWLAKLVSYLGDWFNLLASAALITTLTGSGTAISWLFLARFLPLFFVSPLAGVVADRVSRRQIMIVSDRSLLSACTGHRAGLVALRADGRTVHAQRLFYSRAERAAAQCG